MALTIPTITQSPALSIQVTSGSESINTTFVLNPSLVGTFTDSDLTTKVQALKDAISGFLVSGDDINVYAAWIDSATSVVINTQDTVS